jgi:hypothetical protein
MIDPQKWMVFMGDDDCVHVIPSHEHELSKKCWCEPDVEDYTPEGGTHLYLHREVQ